MAGASPSTLTLAWVTEAVIWSFTEVGYAMCPPDRARYVEATPRPGAPIGANHEKARLDAEMRGGTRRKRRKRAEALCTRGGGGGRRRVVSGRRVRTEQRG